MAKQDYLSPPPIDPLSPEANRSPLPTPGQAVPGAATPVGVPGAAVSANTTSAPATNVPGGTTPPATNPVATGPTPTPPGLTPAAQVASRLEHEHKALHTKFVICLIAAIIFCLTTIVFVTLFILKSRDYTAKATDVDGQIEVAVANAVNANTQKLQDDFEVSKNYPYKTFSAPDDYGGVSFEYPKKWSVYVAKDAKDNKGDYEAYFNVDAVNPVSDTTVNALRFTIKTKSIDDVKKEYDKLVEKGEMNLEQRSFNSEKYPELTGVSYYLYQGKLPNKLRGAVALFTVRDKTVIVQTDSEDLIDTGEQCIGFLCPVMNTMHYNK